MPPNSTLFSSVFDSQVRSNSRTKTPAVPLHQKPALSLHQKHDVLVKDAKQQLNASIDVIFHVLDDIGVSADTINELRHCCEKQKYDQVLEQAMQFVLAFQTYGGCVVVISGWEALSRLRTIRYKRALKVVRNMKLQGGGDIRKANFELLHLAESCAASQLGLYKAHAWNKRVERREGILRRSTPSL